MHLSTLFGLSLLSALPFVQGAAHEHRRHTFQVRRPSGNETELHTLSKRFDNCRFTFYDVGLGSCGKVNVASDFIVALNTPQYGDGYPGPNCFKSITISAKGKTTSATIMDQCPGCPYGGLDFSRGLFNFFASEDEGVITGSWWFNDGSNSGGAQTTKSPDPTTPAWTPTTTSTTPKWTPTTTSTWEEPKWTPTTTSTSEWQEPTTSSTSTHQSSSSSSLSSSSAPPPSSSSEAPSSSAEPSSPSSSANVASTTSSTTPAPSQTSAIEAAGQALLGIVGLYVAGADLN